VTKLLAATVSTYSYVSIRHAYIHYTVTNFDCFDSLIKNITYLISDIFTSVDLNWPHKVWDQVRDEVIATDLNVGFWTAELLHVSVFYLPKTASKFWCQYRGHRVTKLLAQSVFVVETSPGHFRKGNYLDFRNVSSFWWFVLFNFVREQRKCKNMVILTLFGVRFFQTSYVEVSLRAQKYSYKSQVGVHSQGLL